MLNISYVCLSLKIFIGKNNEVGKTGVIITLLLSVKLNQSFTFKNIRIYNFITV